MKRILLVLVIILCFNVIMLSAATQYALPKQIIALNIDSEACELAFISTGYFAGKTTTAFLTNFNMLSTKYENQTGYIVMPLGYTTDPNCVFILPKFGLWLWQDTYNNIEDIKKKSAYFSIIWTLSTKPAGDATFKDTHETFISFIQPDNKLKNSEIADDFTITKTLDDNPLSFCLIVSNKTETEKTIDGFFSSKNQLIIEFPNGKTCNLSGEDDMPDITIAPQHYYLKSIDVGSLLQCTKDYSMKDFENGLSRLIWQLTLPTGETITRTFYLVKFNQELPVDNGNGYKVNGNLNDSNTFKNNLFEALPSAKVESVAD